MVCSTHSWSCRLLTFWNNFMWEDSPPLPLVVLKSWVCSKAGVHALFLTAGYRLGGKTKLRLDRGPKVRRYDCHHVLYLCLLLCTSRVAQVLSTSHSKWPSEIPKTGRALFQHEIPPSKTGLADTTAGAAERTFFPTAICWWLQHLPKEKETSNTHLLCLQSCESSWPPWVSNNTVTGCSNTRISYDDGEATPFWHESWVMNIIGAVTIAHFLHPTVVSCSLASAVPFQLANTLLLSPSLKKSQQSRSCQSQRMTPKPQPGRVLALFLKSTLFGDLHKQVWTALWPLAGQKTGRQPSWEKDLCPYNEDFSWCDILLCADVLSWVPRVTMKADFRLLNSQLLFCLLGLLLPGI